MTARTPMLPQELIARKRDGAALSDAEIDFLVAGLTDGTISDAQIAAFAMAVYFNGMTWAERIALTRAMTRSGTVIDWSPAALGGPVVDKHSTGGVGDKVSLILAPLLAACGVTVPMIAGRGLGHTGGTIDKLEAIPGYRSALPLPEFRQAVGDVGCAIIAQTDALAPADRRFYAVRDVTATVESIDLITASILSKKLAAGIDALIMDVKYGSGAFMRDYGRAVDLARAVVGVGSGAGMTTAALLTDMNEVLGTSAGNAVEVREAIDFLTGAARAPRLDTVIRALAAELLMLSGAVPCSAEAAAAVDTALASGAAGDRFARMVAALGGPADIIEAAADHMPLAPIVRPVAAARAGYVQAIDVAAVGYAVVELGGGRTRPGQAIDHGVGLTDVAGIGVEVGPAGRPLATVVARRESDADRAGARLRDAFEVASERPPSAPVIAARVTVDGVEPLAVPASPA